MRLPRLRRNTIKSRAGRSASSLIAEMASRGVVAWVTFDRGPNGTVLVTQTDKPAELPTRWGKCDVRKYEPPPRASKGMGPTTPDNAIATDTGGGTGLRSRVRRCQA